MPERSLVEHLPAGPRRSSCTTVAVKESAVEIDPVNCQLGQAAAI
jgi:hypothetical protein